MLINTSNYLSNYISKTIKKKGPYLSKGAVTLLNSDTRDVSELREVPPGLAQDSGYYVTMLDTPACVRRYPDPALQSAHHQKLLTKKKSAATKNWGRGK